MNKYLIIASILLATSMAMADCCDCRCPKPKPVCKPRIITKTVTVEKPVITEKVVVVEKPTIKERVIVKEQIVVKKVYKKNRVSLLAGSGPTRLEKDSPKVNLLREPVGGIQYQRMFSNSFSIGVQVQTNETVLGSVGIDF
jgi:hypothetical protein